MKFLKLLCVAALMLSVAAIAYAETQSVKVSGDLGLRSFARDNYSLNGGRLNPLSPAGAINTGVRSTSWDTYLLSTAEVQIEADVTDNVSGVIRLANQRIWGDGNAYSGGQGTPVNGSAELGWPNAPWTNTSVGVASNPTSAAAFDVVVDLAYIELKEFLYSPLTLKIGRQDLWFGKGFIVGANRQIPQNELLAPEYTTLNGFDAIRATLDYDPWTIDAVYAKIQENAMGADDDYNLWGANVGYVFDSYNAEAEAYWWYQQRRYQGTTASPIVFGGMTTNTISANGSAHSNDIYTIGGRGSVDPIENWTISGEAAYQWGKFMNANNQVNVRNRSAWAIDIDLECRYFQEQYAWKPVLGAEYIFYSGQTDMANGLNPNAAGTYTGWDPVFRGKYDTKIREWQNVYYLTDMWSSPANTNQHQMLFKGSIEPLDSVTLDATYGYFWLANDFATDTRSSVGGLNAPQNEERNLGQELDLEVTWDYTEDVSFGFLAAWFFPGKHFAAASSSMRDVATDLVGTVKLSF